MACSQCRGIERQFDDSVARRQLRRYLRKGSPKTTRMLLEAVTAEGIEGATFLDIGGGVGAIQHDLMAAGAAGGTSAEASPAYLSAARAEAERRGYADRLRYVEGDFVETHGSIEPADVVTLDRVLCCYPHMSELVDASASRARRVYALVYPRETAFVKVGMALVNFVQRLRRHPFRAFVHSTAEVETRVRSHGLQKISHTRSIIWQIVVFGRPGSTPLQGT